MKSKKITQLAILIFLLSLITGCAAFDSNLDANALQKTAEAHLTSVAYLDMTAQAIARKTDSVLPTLPPTQTYEPTITRRPQTLIPTNTPGPSPTITPSATSSSTPSPTPLAQAVVNGDTNCRTGPSKSYNWVALITAGTTVNVVARDISGQYLVIKNPFDNNFCWLWNYHVTLIGQLDQLPKYANPPTPRPTSTPRNTIAPRFRIYEEGLIECGGQNSLVIRISNYTRDGFSSWRARVFTSPGYIHLGTYSENQFSHSAEECQLTLNYLPYRQTGYAIIPIDIDQADRFLIEFEACTLDGKYGACAFDGLYIDKVDLVGTPEPTP